MSIEQTIVEKVTTAFSPTILHIENESYLHHSGKGAESHFKLIVVSASFEGKSAVSRHREVYTCLSHELENGVHALALHLFTPTEWQAAGGVVPASPNCAGHGK